MDRIHEELKRPIMNTSNSCTESSSDTDSSPASNKRLMGGNASSDGTDDYVFDFISFMMKNKKNYKKDCVALKVNLEGNFLA